MGKANYVVKSIAKARTHRFRFDSSSLYDFISSISLMTVEEHKHQGNQDLTSD